MGEEMLRSPHILRSGIWESAGVSEIPKYRMYIYLNVKIMSRTEFL